MIYITGDTHGIHDISKLKKLNNLTKEDYVIICGDAGFCWDGSEHDKIVKDTILGMIPNGTILWIDGNHENFDIIDNLPITEDFLGGKAQILDTRIIHLMRGEVYTIEGKSFFCFGGGQSIDRIYRTEGISWWSREMPSKTEYKNGLDNLAKHNNKVDFIISHTAPHFICKQLVARMYPGEEEIQDYLENIAQSTKFNKWYFGHWHMDKVIDNYYALYNNIEVI